MNFNQFNILPVNELQNFYLWYWKIKASKQISTLMENISASFHPDFHSCALLVLPSPHCRLHSVPLWREQEMQEVLSHLSWVFLLSWGEVFSIGCSHSSFMVAPWSLLGLLFSSSLGGAVVLLRMTSFASPFLLLYCPFFP